ncbi:MAG: SRPBCC domain-containing protein [Bacteroidia bacterium]
MQRTIRIRQYLPYSPAIVWKALSDAETLGKWFMPGDIKPVSAHVFTFRKPPQKGWDGITYCQILRLEPFKTLSYSYKGRASAEKTLACADIKSDLADSAAKGIFTELDTVLKFKLEEQDSGTLLTLEHTGFKGLKLYIVSLVMGKGWKKLIREKLPRVLNEFNPPA